MKYYKNSSFVFIHYTKMCHCEYQPRCSACQKKVKLISILVIFDPRFNSALDLYFAPFLNSSYMCLILKTKQVILVLFATFLRHCRIDLSALALISQTVSYFCPVPPNRGKNFTIVLTDQRLLSFYSNFLHWLDRYNKIVA